jgi:hypothetical protein
MLTLLAVFQGSVPQCNLNCPASSDCVVGVSGPQCVCRKQLSLCGVEPGVCVVSATRLIIKGSAEPVTFSNEHCITQVDTRMCEISRLAWHDAVRRFPHLRCWMCDSPQQDIKLAPKLSASVSSRYYNCTLIVCKVQHVGCT